PGVALLLIASISMLLCQSQNGEKLRRVSLPTHVGMSCSLLALLIFVCWQASKAVREQRWLDRANTAASVQERIARLERAFALEPTNFQTAYLIGENYRL